MGSNGRTRPKPIKSMKTVRKTTRTDGFLMHGPPCSHSALARSERASDRYYLPIACMKLSGETPVAQARLEFGVSLRLDRLRQIQSRMERGLSSLCKELPPSSRR